jgi:hypothetical protein
MEGDDEVAEIEFRAGRLLGLLRLRSKYGRLRREIARAVWRRIDVVDGFVPQVDGVGQSLRCNRVAE